MKTRIYSNMNFERRIGGVFDYKTVAIVVFILFIICSVSSYLNLGIKATFVIICSLMPFFMVLLFCNTKNENSLSVIYNVIRFYKSNGIYIKDYNEIKRLKIKSQKIYMKKELKENEVNKNILRRLILKLKNMKNWKSNKFGIFNKK